jgi:hypothetical protein
VFDRNELREFFIAEWRFCEQMFYGVRDKTAKLHGQGRMIMSFHTVIQVKDLPRIGPKVFSLYSRAQTKK